jgi:UDP-2-acetamido-2-deoxy-ribo-hexuluronate aminotransferase
LQRFLTEKGIPTSVHYPLPVYQQPAFETHRVTLPLSENAAQEVISLPMNPYLGSKDLDTICSAVESFARSD